MYKKRNNIILCVSMFMGCILFLLPSMAIEKKYLNDNFSKTEKAENIILMIPDNQAFSNVIEARILLNGIDGDVYYQEALEDIGYKRTCSISGKRDDSPEDSPALWTAEEFINNEILNKEDSNTGEYADLISSILKLANAKGKATGIVVTSAIFNAGHSNFTENMVSFDCGPDMARQYIEDEKIDLIFGGGLFKSNFRKEEAYAGSPEKTDNCFDISGLAISKGYRCITNRTEMEAAVAGGVKKILGFFGSKQEYPGSGKTPELFRVDGSDYPDGEPTLPEMTVAAMNILEKDRNGYLLVVEGTQVNRVNHGDDIEYLLAESLAFDKTVNEVLGWVNESPIRKNNTLVVILTDDDCVRMGLTASTDFLTESGGPDFIDGRRRSSNFKAGETIIFSQGPGSERLKAAFINANLYDIMDSILN